MTKSDRQQFNSWLNSISILGRVSSVEISTMIVDEIVEEIFIPFEVYQAIYLISPGYLAESDVDGYLRDRYLRLRRQLELQYALLLTDKNSILYNEELAIQVKEDLPLLAQDDIPWSNLPCRLPPPVNFDGTGENKVLYQLLAEPHFKSTLRHLGTIKASLDRQNLELSLSINNLTYAQTVIQLDGKIVNRYASEIVEHPQQKEIVKLHQAGVEAGTKQWYKLLQFITETIQRSRRLQ